MTAMTFRRETHFRDARTVRSARVIHDRVIERRRRDAERSNVWISRSNNVRDV